MESDLLGSKVYLTTQLFRPGRSVQVGTCVQLFLCTLLTLAQSNIMMTCADQN